MKEKVKYLRRINMRSKWSRIRLQAISMTLAGTMFLLSGCGGSGEGSKKEEEKGKQEVVYSGDIEPSARGFRATLTDE